MLIVTGNINPSTFTLIIAIPGVLPAVNVLLVLPLELVLLIISMVPIVPGSKTIGIPSGIWPEVGS